LAIIKPEAEMLFNQKSVQSHWTRIHGQVKKKHSTNQHFLATTISIKQEVQPTVLKRMMQGLLYPYPISSLTSIDTFDHELFLTHFAPPTTASEFKNSQFFAKRTRDEADSEFFGQPIYHQVRIDTKLHYYSSFCDSIDNIFATIANFLTVAEGFVHVPEWGISSENPSILNFFHEIASLLSDADARAQITATSRLPQFRHLLFTIFGCFQDILASFGDVIRTSHAVNLIVLDKQDEIDPALFYPVIQSYKRGLSTLSNFVKLGITTNLIAEPLSFSKIFPSIKPDSVRADKDDSKELPVSKRNRKEVKHHKDAKGNWLLCLDRGFKFNTFNFPANIGRFCLCFAIKDLSCKKGNDCSLPHIDYSALSTEQKDAFKACLTTNPAFKLAE
jgi:hypothetical protein